MIHPARSPRIRGFAHLREFGEAVAGVLGEPEKAHELGRAARRVARLFITPCHLVAQGRLLAGLTR